MNDPDLIDTMAEVSGLSTARQPARCAVTGCNRPIKARGWCDTHYTRWRRTGDPRGDTPIGARSVPHPDSYPALRQRIRRQRGPASALACVDCGTGARDWSYDYSDPNERTDPAHGYHYSTDAAQYVPRCRSCHRRATRRRGRPLDAPRCARLYRDGHTLAALAQLTGHSTAEIRRALVTTETPIRRNRRRPRHTHPSSTRDHDERHDQKQTPDTTPVTTTDSNHDPNHTSSTHKQHQHQEATNTKHPSLNRPMHPDFLGHPKTPNHPKARVADARGSTQDGDGAC